MCGRSCQSTVVACTMCSCTPLCVSPSICLTDYLLVPWRRNSRHCNRLCGFFSRCVNLMQVFGCRAKILSTSNWIGIHEFYDRRSLLGCDTRSVCATIWYCSHWHKLSPASYDAMRIARSSCDFHRQMSPHLGKCILRCSTWINAPSKSCIFTL